MRRAIRYGVAAAMALLRAGIATGQPPVGAPAGFVPQQAVSYGAAGAPSTAVDDAHPLPVSTRSRPITQIDRSGTTAAAGSAQQIAAANPVRGGFLIENLSTADLWLSASGAATPGQPSLRIGAGQLFEFPAGGVPGGAISLLGTSAGQAYAAKEW